MAIESVQIATNRNAPAGSEAINLYSYEYASNLTIAQLVQAVCLRSAATCEKRSVIKMNMMASGSDTLDYAANWLKKIADGSANWTDAKNFMATMGIPASGLPDDIDTYEKRMQAAKALQDKMNLLAQSQQEDMIDLQTLVNRRDVAYSTSSGMVRSLGQSTSQDAANFLN